MGPQVSEDLGHVLIADFALRMGFDEVRTETNILSDQGDRFAGSASC
jgi:hypothetical protein